MGRVQGRGQNRVHGSAHQIQSEGLKRLQTKDVRSTWLASWRSGADVHSFACSIPPLCTYCSLCRTLQTGQNCHADPQAAFVRQCIIQAGRAGCFLLPTEVPFPRGGTGTSPGTGASAWRAVFVRMPGQLCLRCWRWMAGRWRKGRSVPEAA